MQMMASKKVARDDLFDLVRDSLQIKKEFNREYLKKLESYIPSQLTEEAHSLVTVSDKSSTEHEELQKKSKNLYKRINELEVTNDSLRLKLGVDESVLLDQTTEHSTPNVVLTAEQLKIQRNMLRTELAKCIEHRKKADQLSMEAKHHAQRLTAENEQLKESLRKLNSDMEQVEAKFHSERQKYSNTVGLETSTTKLKGFESHIEKLIEEARLQFIDEEVNKKIAERMPKIHTEQDTVYNVERSLESTEINTTLESHGVNLEDRGDSGPGRIVTETVPLVMCSVVIVGLPGTFKNNIIKDLFKLYSINYQPKWEDKDIILTKIDIKRDKGGQVSWLECPGDECDVLRLIIHKLCDEKGISVDQALEELTSSDALLSLSSNHVDSFKNLLHKLKKKPSLKSHTQVTMCGMSQVFDLQHNSTAFAQIPVLFTNKRQLITIFVCEERTNLFCPRANGDVTMAESIMFWATYLGHFKSDTCGMLIAFAGNSQAASALLSDLTNKTKEIGVKNIFLENLFEVSQKSGMSLLQTQLNKLFTATEKSVKLSWLLLHSALMEISKFYWIPYVVVKQLACVFHINKSELHEVLQFWSSTTSILYRDVGCLKDVVFLDTVWLAKELCKVLSLSPHLSNLLQYGIVEQCIAEKHWLKISTAGGKTTKAGPHQLLLDYFTGFMLACVIPSMEGRQHLQCSSYFLPSLLKPCKDYATKNRDSLFLPFSQSFVPIQIFPQIIVRLLRDENLTCVLNKAYLFSNKISLHIGLCCDLLLTEHRFSVEINYSCNYCVLQKKNLVKTIRNVIEECCSEMALNSSFKLMCPNDVHYINLPDVKTQYIHCRTCASHVALSDYQQRWIIEPSNLSIKPRDASPAPEVNIDYLIKIAEKINTRDARRLALELGFFNAEFEFLLSFAQEKRIILYILITWLDRSDQLKDKHITLDQALIATGYNTLVVASTDLNVHRNQPIEDSDLRTLAEHISSAWDTLAFFCDMDNDGEFMEELKQYSSNVDAAYYLLKKWSQRHSGPDLHKELVKHLHQLSLPLVAHHFEQGTLNSYNLTSNKRFL